MILRRDFLAIPIFIPLRTETSDEAVAITYGDAELEEILGGTRAFPGIDESERIIEIFRPEPVDGVEDFTILPDGEGLFLPTTGFPQGDELLEEILNGGIFTGGGDELPEGAYFLTIGGEGSIRGLKKNGSLTETDLTPYEKTIGESLVAEGNRLIGVDDDNVRKSLGIPKNIRAADYLSVTPSGRFNLTEVKGSDPRSTTGAKVGDAIIQLTNTYNALIELIPDAKIGKIEVAIPEGAPIPSPYKVQGNQIVEVTVEGTKVVRIGGQVLTIRR